MLKPNTLEEILKFLKLNPAAVGVSPNVLPSKKPIFRGTRAKIENAIDQAFFLDSHIKENVLRVTKIWTKRIPKQTHQNNICATLARLLPMLAP